MVVIDMTSEIEAALPLQGVRKNTIMILLKPKIWTKIERCKAKFSHVTSPRNLRTFGENRLLHKQSNMPWPRSLQFRFHLNPFIIFSIIFIKVSIDIRPTATLLFTSHKEEAIIIGYNCCTAYYFRQRICCNWVYNWLQVNIGFQVKVWKSYKSI